MYIFTSFAIKLQLLDIFARYQDLDFLQFFILQTNMIMTWIKLWFPIILRNVHTTSFYPFAKENWDQKGKHFHLAFNFPSNRHFIMFTFPSFRRPHYKPDKVFKFSTPGSTKLNKNIPFKNILKEFSYTFENATEFDVFVFYTPTNYIISNKSTTFLQSFYKYVGSL